VNNLFNDERIEKLLDAISDALTYCKTDERNASIREKVIFRQLAEKLLTDFERAEYYGLPKTCRMREGAKIISPEKLVCGENVYISENAVLDASGGLEIGSHTGIGINVCIFTHSMDYTTLSLSLNYPTPYGERRPVKIGNGRSVNANSVVVPGVTIADKTTILPLSYVKNSVKETNCVVSGNPAAVIGKISDKAIAARIRMLNSRR
jgi:acetyltransferase-like isoleucine patch superfamily enzyme